MAGIRSFNTNLPHVFRFPEWVAGIYYPKGSVVVDSLVDNGTLEIRYYVSVVDGPSQNITPADYAPGWKVLFEDPLIDSDIVILLSDSDFVQKIKKLDSEIEKLRIDVDSDRLRSFANDSDILLSLDSEIHNRKAADSEILLDLDSEVHARKAADSDILHRLSEIDSEILLLWNKSDSDVIVALMDALDSEISARMSADSDFQVLVTQAVHNYLSNDSEIDSEIQELKDRLDSDFDAAIRVPVLTGNDFSWGPQPFVSNTDFYINQGTLTNHTQGYLWLVDHDTVGGTRTATIRIILDGVVIDSAPGDLTTTQISTGNGIWTRSAQITDGGGGADVNIYQDIASATPQVTNANVFVVRERAPERSSLVTTTSMDDALRRTVRTVVAIDSDLHELINKDSERDSDARQFRHDLLKLDSEVLILMADRDSDTGVIQHLQEAIDSEEHARRTGDSELNVKFTDLIEKLTGGFDSDLTRALSDIEELFNKDDSEDRAGKDADSDIYNKYHSVTYRYLKSEYSSPTLAGGTYFVDFDGTGSVLSKSNIGSFWFWNTFNDRLIISDSDENVIYNEIHPGEPISVSVGQIEYKRLSDTGSNAVARLNGADQVTDDIWQYRTTRYTKTQEDKDSKLVAIVDSDINLHEKDSDELNTSFWLADKLNQFDSDLFEETHDREGGDSDLLVIINDLDSELRRQLDSEIHERRAVDSDLSHGWLTSVRLESYTIESTITYDGGNGTFVWYKNGGSIGTNGTGFGGPPTVSVGDRITTDAAQNNPINAFVITDNNVLIPGSSGVFATAIVDGWVVAHYNLEDSLTEEITRANYPNKPISGVGGKFYVAVNAERYNRRGDTSFYDVATVIPVFTLFEDSEYNTTYERDQVISESIRNLYYRDYSLVDDLEAENKRMHDSDRADRKAEDLKLQIQITDNDSDILMEIHDRKAVDSDIISDMDSDIHDLKAADSDLSDRITDNDSDILMEIHDRGAADSDIRLQFDSERHDWKASDSDIRVDIDSDVHYLKAADSELNNGYLKTVRLESYTTQSVIPYDGGSGTFVWFKNGASIGTNGTGFGGPPTVSVGDRITTDAAQNNPINAFVITDNNVLIPGSSGVFATAIVDGWVVAHYNMKDTAGTEITRANYPNKPIIGEENKFYAAASPERYNRRGDTSFYDVAIVVPVYTLFEDSDYDSTYERDTLLSESFKNLFYRDLTLKDVLEDENKRMHDSDRHDRAAADSDLQVQITDNDSDILMEIHDRRAADSDIQLILDRVVLYNDDSEIETKGIWFNNDSEGYLFYNDNRETLAFKHIKNAEFVQNVGQDQFMYGKFTGAVSKGDAIMFAGAQGDHLLFTKANVNAAGFRDEWIVGVAPSDYANNDYGHVQTAGLLQTFDTSMWTEGNILYLDNDNAYPGRLLDSEPASPNHSILVAAVTRSHANQGSIYVRPTFGKSHLGDLHDVSILNPSHNQFVAWDSDTDLWKNLTVDVDYGTF